METATEQDILTAEFDIYEFCEEGPDKDSESLAIHELPCRSCGTLYGKSKRADCPHDQYGLCEQCYERAVLKWNVRS